MRKFQTKAEAAQTSPAVVSNNPGLPFPLFNLKPGEPRKISPVEMAALEKLGWTEGQPVPMNLADATEQAKLAAGIVGDNLAAITTGSPGVVEIDQLPAAQQDSLRQSLAQMMQQAEIRRNTPTVPGAPANLQASINAAQRSAISEAAAYANTMAPPKRPEIEFEGNDQYTPVTQQINQDIEALKARRQAVAPHTGLDPKVEARLMREEQEAIAELQRRSARESALSAALPAETSNTGLLPTPPEVCPHCGLKTMHTDPPLTMDEKTQYLAGILSAAGRYFETVELFRGKVKIVFRTPTAAEERLCSEQISRDLKAEPLDQIDTINRMNRYWAAVTTASVQIGDRPQVYFPPAAELAGNPVLDVLATVDDELAEALFNKAWLRESIKFYHKLQRLLAAAANPDF